uniref:Uncharacterized protein n=1 Tax=Avena sativa TaxID=4498 RepID=A0ACD5ZW62_AVESA
MCSIISGDQLFHHFDPIEIRASYIMQVRQVQVETCVHRNYVCFFFGRSVENMGSCSSKGDTAARPRSATVHPYPWSAVPAPGQRVAVRMRASEFHALRAAAAGNISGGDADVGRAILDGCVVGRWTWSPASSS